MRYFLEIVLFILSISFGYAKPTAGINFKKHLEIEFNPKPLKSLELIFERWTRFGKLGIRHKVEKRDVNNIIDLNDGLSDGKENLQVVPIKMEPADGIPQPAQNVVIVSTGKASDSTEKPVKDLSENSIVIPVIEPSNEITPSVKPFLTITGEPNVVVTIPIVTSTIAPVTSNIPSVPVNSNLTPASSGLYTNILQTLNNIPLRGVNGQNINLPVSNLENQNFILRGSRFAMYLGTMLLRMLSDYFYGGRGGLPNFPGQEVTPL